MTERGARVQDLESLDELVQVKAVLNRVIKFAEQMIQSNYGDEGGQLADSYRSELRRITNH